MRGVTPSFFKMIDKRFVEEIRKDIYIEYLEAFLDNCGKREIHVPVDLMKELIRTMNEKVKLMEGDNYGGYGA